MRTTPGWGEVRGGGEREEGRRLRVQEAESPAEMRTTSG